MLFDGRGAGREWPLRKLLGSLCQLQPDSRVAADIPVAPKRPQLPMQAAIRKSKCKNEMGRPQEGPARVFLAPRCCR
jgi:hypothetical protein